MYDVTQTPVRWWNLRRFSLAIIYLAVVSFSVFVITGAYQIFERGGYKGPGSVRVAVEATGDSKTPERPPQIHPLDLLPKRIEGFNTAAYHKVPGSEEREAEAIYEPADEGVAIQTPLNVYAKITYHESTAKASEALRSILPAYPVNAAEIKFDGRTARSGFRSEGQGYFIGWTVNEYSIVIDAAFTYKVPVEGASRLSEQAKKTSLAVLGSLNRRLPQASAQ